MKKSLLVIIVLMIGLAFVSAQSSDDINKLYDDMMAGKITYFELLEALSASSDSQRTKYDPAQLITAPGKAWIIKDNEVQGGGRAIVFTAGGGVEAYNRKYGIWVPSFDNMYSETTYSATETRLTITSNDSYYNTLAGEYLYAFSGSTLTISEGRSGADGTYTLMDFSGPEKPGGSGSFVLPAGKGWFYDGRQMIFNTSGIYGAYGWPAPWEGPLHEGTYSVNTSAGKVTINENVPPVPGRDREYNYSITTFSDGSKTLRIWLYAPRNIGPLDDVYKLETYSSDTKLPRTR
jgi:hypothetical protein